MIEYFIWIPLLIETYRNIPHANGKKSKQNSVPLIFDCYFYAQELIEIFGEAFVYWAIRTFKQRRKESANSVTVNKTIGF